MRGIIKITDSLELRPFELSEKYRKKWNVNKSLNDFLQLYSDNKLVSDSIYRVGGFGYSLNGMYFQLLKQVEDHYDDSITKIKKDKPHLSSCNCILNLKGEEVRVFNKFEHVYLIGGVVYSLNNKIHNIETNEFYGSGKTMKSGEFIFVDNNYHDDKSKRGILRINKITGETKLYKS